MRKSLVLFPVLVVAWGCGVGPPTQGSMARPRLVKASTAAVAAVDTPTYFEATGALRSRFNATLSSKVMSRVASVLVREGDEIRAGQVLVALDNRELASAFDVARANVSASTVGVASARTTRDMETRTSAARIAQAQAAVLQAKAALSAAQSKLDMAVAGPRLQEKTQAHLAVIQADSSLRLAKAQLDRVSMLVREGAMPKKELDQAQTAYDVAVAQRDTAVQSEKIAQEGTRSEELHAARDGVAQLRAAVKEAEANLAQAQASALQAKVRAEQVRAAQAQVSQSVAEARAAEVTLGYATVTAPFDGRVVLRAVDPGAMATPGSPLMTVEGKELRLEASVPESVVPGVKLGMNIEMNIDALHDRRVGKVVEIAPQGDSNTHSFIVRVLVANSNGLRSGMFGRALFPTGHEKRILIPTGASWEREGLSYVYVVNSEGIARLRIVTLGEPSNGRVAVLSGLNPGERIVTEGRSAVEDGDRVGS